MNTGQTEATRLEERQKILLEMIEGFSRALEHPTSALLHDYILLCRLKRGEELFELQSYDFRACIRGPFSEQLRRDLKLLYNLNLIEVKGDQLAVTSSGKKLTQKNKEVENLQAIRAVCQQILEEFDSPHAISQGIFDSLSRASLGEKLSSL